MKEYSVVQTELFPTTLLTTNIQREFTDKELEFINSQEEQQNQGNSYSKNTYVLNDPVLKELNDFCQNFIELYCRQIYNMDTSIKPYITQSWFNFADPGEYHPQHRHSNSFISGVLYISDNNHLKITNSNPPSLEWKFGTNNWSNTSCMHATMFDYPKGSLVLFPSSTHHEVPPNKSKDRRISLAFNTFLSGSLLPTESNYSSLQELNLHDPK